MAGEIKNLGMDFVEFLNLYPLRAPRVVWMPGEGASVLAGLPPAATVI
jgi:hypothetical protein